MTSFFREVCPGCGSEDTVLLGDDDLHQCLECGEFFEGVSYDRRPKQIRVKKPYKEQPDGPVRGR
jgi:uncharacterized Zn finger protein